MVQYIFSAGEQVERVIDDVWYLAKVISYDPKGRVYSIEYLDDGKTEHNVMCDEVRGLVKRLEKSAVEAHPLELGIDEQPEQEREQAQNGKTGKLGPEWQTPLADEKLHKIREVLTTKTHPVIDDTSSEARYRISRQKDARPRRRHSFHTLQGLGNGHRGIDFHPWAGVCEQCEKMTIYRCSRCAIAYYCSRACQRQHYKHHSSCCKLSARAIKPLYRLSNLPTDTELLKMLDSGSNESKTDSYNDKANADNLSTNSPVFTQPSANKKLFIPISSEKTVSFADSADSRSRKADRDGTRRDDEGYELQDFTSSTGKRQKPFSSETDDPSIELSRGMKRLHVSGNQPDFLTGDEDNYSRAGSLVADESLVVVVCDMLAGTVGASQVRDALEMFRNNMDQAIDYLLTGPPEKLPPQDSGQRGFVHDSDGGTINGRHKRASADPKSESSTPSSGTGQSQSASQPKPSSDTALVDTTSENQLLLFSGQRFIEKRPCSITIKQRSLDDFTISVEILVLDAELGEDPHTHQITVKQADFLSVVRIHEPHPQDILSEGNEYQRAETIIKYLGGQITTEGGKDLLHYVVCTPSGRVLALSDIPEDITSRRDKFSYGPPPDPAAPLLLPTTTVDPAVVTMLVEMLGVDRDKAHAAAAMHDNDPDRAANYLLTSL